MELVLDDTQIEEAQGGGHFQVLNKSCEGCRARKIRCQPDPNSSSGKCARCEKKSISCIFNPPNARRRRKRTDVRVAALEKELESLRSRLDSNGDSSTASLSPLPTSQQTQANTVEKEIDEIFPAEQESDPQLTLEENLTFTMSDQYDEAMEMDLNLDEVTQHQVFDKFVKELLPHLPFIYFNSDITFHHLRHRQSILLKAILAASAASLYPPLGQALAVKLEREYADRIMVRGEKSIELIQALLVTAVWYQPPTRFQDLKFTMYGHLAANMALDLRLANSRPLYNSEGGIANQMNSLRVVITCYLLCTSMALALHRPSMVQYMDWADKNLDVLRDSAVPGDRELAVWTDLQYIAEESAASLGLDEKSQIELKDNHTQTLVKAFERQLAIWKESNWTIINGSLKAHFHYVRLNLHEIALHHDYDATEFKPPYLMRPRPIRSSFHSEISPVYITSLIACVESAHGILDIILNMAIHTVRSAPVILFTRMFYAVVILSKLSLSVQSRGSAIGKILDIENIKLVDYLFKIMSMLKEAAGDENISVPFTFYAIIARLTAWYHRVYKTSRTQNVADEVINPLKYLRVNAGDTNQKDTSTTRHLNQAQSFSQGHLESTLFYGNPTSIGPSIASDAFGFSSNISVRHAAFAVNHDLGVNAPLMAIQAQSTLQIPTNTDQMDFEVFHSFDEFGAYSSLDHFENTSLLSFAQQDFGEWSDTFTQQ